MADDFTLELKRFEPTDKRLGRHVCHDSRSRRFSAPARDPRKLSSVRHHINIAIMDQGNVGSCTGHAGTAALAADQFWGAGKDAIGVLDPHIYAEHLYSAATELDPWPGVWIPEDTGSDGLSIAKALKNRGLISGFEHAFSLEATLAALALRPVLIGSAWLGTMYDVDPSDGRVSVDGPELGGHEYLLDELDVPNKRVWIRNSWGLNWGIQGRAYLTWDDLGKLLANQGDCTVLVPLALPPPTPTPEPPPPSPAATRDLAAALRKFVPTKGCPLYLKQAATNYLKENP